MNLHPITKRARLIADMLRSVIDTLPSPTCDALAALCGMEAFATWSAERRQQRAAEIYGVSRSYFPKTPKRELLHQLTDVLCSWEVDASKAGNLTPAVEVGALAYFHDFVDLLNALWERLILETERLCIVMNYGSTWRNTHRKTLVQACNAGMELTVVLPDCSPKSALPDLHAQRHGIAKAAFKAKVDEAISDLHANTNGEGKLFVSTTAFQHSAHIFDGSSILSFYTLSGSRDETPAIHLKRDQGLDTFVRKDVMNLVGQSPQSPRTSERSEAINGKPYESPFPFTG